MEKMEILRFENLKCRFRHKSGREFYGIIRKDRTGRLLFTTIADSRRVPGDAGVPIDPEELAGVQLMK